jgi:glyoxylase-like metal-dependent hydrolase (beta-lactamase superfamily II)
VSWDIGGVRITRVTEFVMPFTFDFFVEATPADIAAERWLSPDFVDSDGRYLMSLHTFIVETAGLRIAVDTCVGNAKDRPLIPEFDRQDRPFLTDLAAAGFAPETIDLVVCTHLHVDHVGWNTRLVDGVWLPTFPRARYLFAANDIDFWANSKDPLHSQPFADSVQPVIDAGLVDAVDGATTIARDVELRPTPGHTPGHMSVWIADRCVITGDALHHPIQCVHPDWTARGDTDPDLARATRTELLDTAAKKNALMLGTHFAGSSAGHVVSVGDRFRFVPEPAG